jgi:hypothetical protein
VEERATLVANLNPREQGRTREHRGVHKIKRKSSVTSQPNRSGSSATSKYLKPGHMKYDLHWYQSYSLACFAVFLML